MKNCKFEKKGSPKCRTFGIKSIAIALALVLLVGGIVDGTVAWLTATSSKVENVFTTSNIGVKLEETKGTTDEGGYEFKMVPGWTIEKDPKVTVTEGSEDCYLFIKVEESNNFGNYMIYEIAEGWTQLTGVDGVSNVYYKVFNSKDNNNTNAMGTPYSILEDDQVTVLEDVDQAMMTAAKGNEPTLSFTAYAVQLYEDGTNEFDVTKAWDLVKDLQPTTP